jgi:hypothetical protein
MRTDAYVCLSLCGVTPRGSGCWRRSVSSSSARASTGLSTRLLMLSLSRRPPRAVRNSRSSRPPRWFALCSPRMSCSTGSRSIVRRPAAVLERLTSSLLRARSRSRTSGCPRLVVARPGEDERPDQRVAARCARLGRQVQLARGVEERNDLVDAVEVDGALLGGLELALAGVDPDRVAGDQVVLDGDLEDLPEASDRHRLMTSSQPPDIESEVHGVCSPGAPEEGTT